MRKSLILIMSALLIVFSLGAEETPVHMTYHKENNKGGGGNTPRIPINRIPILLPIEVTYNSDTHLLHIVADEDVKGEVFIYGHDGNIEAYEDSLDTPLYILSHGTHYISIQGDGWVGEGTIKI